MEQKTESIADILDRKPSETSEPSPQETQPEPQAEVTGIARDDKGRFALKTEPKAKAPQATGVKQETAPTPAAAPDQPQPGYVPLAALVDQRLEARQAKQERDELRRQLAEFQKPKAELVDFFSDPDAAFNQRGQSLLDPVQGELKSLKAALFEERLYRVAGGDKAAKIEEEIGKAMESGDPEIPILDNALNNGGPNAVKALIQWYDKRTFDPNAERERLKAELLAELQAEGRAPAPQAKQKPAPVMPSNLAGARNVGTRAGPAWSGPTPIADIFKK